MKFLEVSDSDVKLFAQLINMLHVAEMKVNGKDVCAAADSIRWLQNVAKAAAECYSQSKTPKVEVSVPPQEIPVTPPPAPGGLPEGVTMKAFNPGKPGRSK